MTAEVLQGVVQLPDGDPLVYLDTTPPTRLNIERRDVVGCFQVRAGLDTMAQTYQHVFDLLVVRYWGVFVRVPGEDVFWPAGELYGIRLASVGAEAQRDSRVARPQMKLLLADYGPPGGMKVRKKGHKR